MRIRKISLILVLATLIGLTNASHPYATLAQTQVPETQVTVTKTRVTYDFGEQITFRATLKAGSPPQKALLVFEETNQPYTSIEVMQATPQGEDTYELAYIHPLEEHLLRPFSTIEYHIEVRLENNQTYTSLNERFEYIDNRFEWQSRAESPFEVYWYEGDTVFAQSVLDVAQDGLQRLQGLLRLPQPGLIKIYAYPDSQTMQAALKPSSEGWIAGHADPDLGVILVTLPPGPEQRLMIEQRIPHEIAHVALYQMTRQGYENLPIWLNEGVASLAELYQNSDYYIILEDAKERDSLLPMSSLCQNFPRDVSSALLSYAQAASFTQYLHDTYGVSGLQKLVDTYANGYECERGAKVALGAGLSQIERQWQRDVLAENVTLTTFINLLPWLTLLALALAVPFVMLFRRSKA